MIASLKTNGMFNILAKTRVVVHAYNTGTLEGERANTSLRAALDYVASRGQLSPC